MTTVSISALEDAQLDLQHIADIATSTELTATDRMGNVKRTIYGLTEEYPNAAANAAAAAASASEAGAARDAATVNANIYPTTAAGLAAVADGQQFMVIDGNEIVRYRRDSAAAAAEVARYSTSGASLIYRGAPVDATLDFNTAMNAGLWLINGPQYNPPPNAPRPAFFMVRNFGAYAVQEYIPINSDAQYGGQKWSRIIGPGPSIGEWVRNFGYMGALGIGADLNNVRVAGVHYVDSVPYNKPSDPDAPNTGLLKVDVYGDNLVQHYMAAGASFDGLVWARTIIASTNTIGRWFRNDFYKGTLIGGDANTIISTGNYLIGGVVENLPEVSGWLNVSRRGDWVLQQVLPLFGGAVKTRTYRVSENTWYAWVESLPSDGAITSIKLSPQFDYKATLTEGDCNDYVDSGGWMVAGEMANSPSGSGWFFVHKFGNAGQFILQRWFDFADPSKSWTRRFYAAWSPWIKQGSSVELKANKNIVCLGDSITEFGDYPARLGAITGASVINAGFGGTRLGQHSWDYDPLSLYQIARYISTGDWSELTNACEVLAGPPTNDDNRAIAARLVAVDWSTVDYIVCFYGTNDFAGEVPIGTDADATGATFKGAINYTVDKICSAYPHIKLLFVAPPWRARILGSPVQDPDTSANGIGTFLIEYVDAMIGRANANKMPCVDMYRTSGINKYNWTTLIPDGLHPGDAAGFQRIAEKVAAGLNANW